MAKLEVATDRIATRKPFAHPNHGTRRVRPTPDRPSGRRPARSEHPDGHEVEWLRLTPVVLPAMSEILTVPELAERFELSEKTVRRAIKAGRLRGERVRLPTQPRPADRRRHSRGRRGRRRAKRGRVWVFHSSRLARGSGRMREARALGEVFYDLRRHGVALHQQLGIERDTERRELPSAGSVGRGRIAQRRPTVRGCPRLTEGATRAQVAPKGAEQGFGQLGGFATRVLKPAP
jgi:hypothetical protein